VRRKTELSMSFRDFRLPDALKQFGLTRREDVGVFAGRPPVIPSPLLAEILSYNVPIASAMGTEKARSELIIAPILMELRRLAKPRISVFSGVDLTVDPAAGLSGTCDFLISASPEQFFVEAPLIAVVEAKNESIKDGLGQCVAEMVAARIFNEREKNLTETVYGTVTTGTVWLFLSLTGNALAIDLIEYQIAQPEKILGILASMVSSVSSAPHSAAPA
jgi:hypothetical protein